MRRTSEASSGRLVEMSLGYFESTLSEVLKRHGGVWVGCLEDGGGLSDEITAVGEPHSLNLHLVSVDEELYDRHYFGFANSVIWPLFHDLQSLTQIEAADWEAFLDVNRAFARTIVEQVKEAEVVWIQDYHLMCVGEMLKEAGLKNPLEFFLQIPFPPFDVFEKLPWRLDILSSLLQYDALGFQTDRDRDNFLDCADRLLNVDVTGQGRVRVVETDGRETRAGTFPAGVDAKLFEEMARSSEVNRERISLTEAFQGRHLILGVDRLDYTKGLLERLVGFDLALTEHPDLREKITLVQFAEPSRSKIDEYAALRTEVEQRIAEINGRHSTTAWIPIYYLARSLSLEERVAYYLAVDTLLATPLKDGMHLVSKEFCAANVAENGAVILSEFSGSKPQMMDGSLVVNPYDAASLAEAIYECYTMPEEERRERMARLRAGVQKEDMWWWADECLHASDARVA